MVYLNQTIYGENKRGMIRTLKEILELLKENNKMLKEIIRYINYINAHADAENNNDFVRNVVANLVSNRIPGVSMGK